LQELFYLTYILRHKLFGFGITILYYSSTITITIIQVLYYIIQVDCGNVI